MEKQQLGNSSLYASMIGLGCMSLKADKAESEYIIHRAMELGVNFFDTADLYEFGKNEVLLGEALKGKRHEMIITTKVGNEWNASKEGWSWNPTKNYIKEALKLSLKRLQTDYIDLYQLHGGTIADPIDETIEAFEELVKEGWIRYYGISSIRPNVIKEYIKRSNIVSVMMQYNMLDRRPEEYFPLLDNNNVSIIARGPLAKGLLTDAFRSKMRADGYLNYSKKELEKTIQKLIELKTEQKNYSLEELAFSFCSFPPTVASIVVGVSSISQLEKNLNSFKKTQLTLHEMKELQKLLKLQHYINHR